VSSGKLKQGVAELENGLKADPENTTALYQLSLAYRKQGRMAEADRAMAAFRDLKAKTNEEQTELVEILKLVK
jgi:predicted Zn-dependent protease